MIDLEVLAAFNTTNERLRDIFTAQSDPNPASLSKLSAEEKTARIERQRQLSHDIQLRERFRRETQTRIEEGIVASLKQWRLYAAVDLAWDSAVATPPEMATIMVFMVGVENQTLKAGMQHTHPESTQCPNGPTPSEQVLKNARRPRNATSTHSLTRPW